MAVLDEGHRLGVPVGLRGLGLFATVDVVLGCATCKNGIEKKNRVLKRDSNGTRDEPGAVVLMIVRKPLSPSTS